MANSSDEIQLRTLIKLSAFFILAAVAHFCSCRRCSLRLRPRARRRKSVRLPTLLTATPLGGVTIDLVGNIYVADFGDVVWKITPEGRTRHRGPTQIRGACRQTRSTMKATPCNRIST